MNHQQTTTEMTAGKTALDVMKEDEVAFVTQLALERVQRRMEERRELEWTEEEYEVLVE